MITEKILYSEQNDACVTVTVNGTWNMTSKATREEIDSILALLDKPQTKSLCLKESNLLSWDSNLLVFLVEIVRYAQQRKLSIQNNLQEGLKRLIALSFEVKRQEGSERTKKATPFLESIGSCVINFIPKLKDFLEFIGETVTALGRFILGRATMRSQDFIQAMHECSVQALPIISITNILFGLILAFVGAVQLTQFGVQIYVAGLVGIGMLRVMGAIMVGIVMSGRVGASYAALLGTMQVNEEIDALTTLGISPVEFLVLPRILALVIMVPLLTIYADCMGILGGFIVGTLMLDISPLEYINATISMVRYSQGLVGLTYATMFGFVIAVAGCYQGMRCGRSAQAVGIATTTAVVHSIVGIIVVTAIITVICNIIGI